MNQQKPPIWCPGIRASQPLAQGLHLYYPFWEAGGTKAMNLGGSSHVATLEQGAVWDGASVDFGGTGDTRRVTVAPGNLGLSTKPFVIAVQVMWTAGSTRGDIFGQTAAPQTDVALLRNSNGTIMLYTRGGSADSNLNSAGTLTTGAVEHVVCGRNADGALWLYVGGIYTSSAKTARNLTATTSLRIGIHGGGSSYPWAGTIGYFAIWRNTQWSQTDAIRWNADPWSLIRPRAKTYFWAPAVQGGAGGQSVVPLVMHLYRQLRTALLLLAAIFSTRAG